MIVLTFQCMNNRIILFFKGTLSKILPKLYKSIANAKQKSLRNIFIIRDMMVSISRFTAHLLRKDSRFYHLFKSRQMLNKEYDKHYGIQWIFFVVELSLLLVCSHHQDINRRMIKQFRIVEQCLSYQYIYIEKIPSSFLYSAQVPAPSILICPK